MSGKWQHSGDSYSDVIEVWSSKADGTKLFLLADVYADEDGDTGEHDARHAHARADLIVAACNACQAINPANPIAVAEAMPAIVEALRQLLVEADPAQEGYDTLTLTTLDEARAALAQFEREGVAVAARTLTAHRVCDIAYRCTTPGPDVETGTVTGYWTGERDTWGKLTIVVLGVHWPIDQDMPPLMDLGKLPAPIYLFPREILSVSEPSEVTL